MTTTFICQGIVVVSVYQARQWPPPSIVIGEFVAVVHRLHQPIVITIICLIAVIIITFVIVVFVLQVGQDDADELCKVHQPLTHAVHKHEQLPS